MSTHDEAREAFTVAALALWRAPIKTAELKWAHNDAAFRLVALLDGKEQTDDASE